MSAVFRERKREIRADRRAETMLEAERARQRAASVVAKRLFAALCGPALVPTDGEPLVWFRPRRWPAYRPPRDEGRMLRVYEYCAYVRCCITTAGIQGATGIDRDQAGKLLRKLEAGGFVRVSRSILREGCCWAFMWEWVGD